ncbi:MAG TPA: hypothetical protein VMF89_35820 [Polyangiales bacterium]|nr:hypothetical protein [Polyangiales bacterium]
MHQHESIGKELAEGAVIPEQVAVLFAHVAFNLREHARGLDDASPGHHALIAVADGYEAISAEAQRVCNYMRTLDSLPASHAAPARDRSALASWMRENVAIQRHFAKLLNEHAEEAERALRELTP